MCRPQVRVGRFASGAFSSRRDPVVSARPSRCPPPCPAGPTRCGSQNLSNSSTHATVTAPATHPVAAGRASPRREQSWDDDGAHPVIPHVFCQRPSRRSLPPAGLGGRICPVHLKASTARGLGKGRAPPARFPPCRRIWTRNCEVRSRDRSRNRCRRGSSGSRQRRSLLDRGDADDAHRADGVSPRRASGRARRARGRRNRGRSATGGTASVARALVWKPTAPTADLDATAGAKRARCWRTCPRRAAHSRPVDADRVGRSHALIRLHPSVLCALPPKNERACRVGV